MSENVTIDDTLRDTYATIMGRGQEGDFANHEPSEPLEPVDPIEPVDPEPAEPIDPAEPAESAEPADPAPVEPAAFRPPWKKAALAEWEKLPEMARKEIERRENDFHKGIEQYKTGAQTAQEWDRAVQPYMATIQSLGVSPQQAATHLMGLDHQLRYSGEPQKIGLLLKIADSYGIGLQALANGIQQVAGEQVWQQQNPLPPQMQSMYSEWQQMKQQQQHERQQRERTVNTEIDANIAAFAADPDHEHFEILQYDMGLLMNAGRASSMEEAYEMAMRQNPQTYQIWLAQQQRKWDEERKATVAKAKQAAANNVRPNGRATVAQSAPANETMEQTIERIARDQGLIN